MSIEIRKLGQKDSNEPNREPLPLDKANPNAGKIDEITIVIRGGQIVKFEQRFV